MRIQDAFVSSRKDDDKVDKRNKENECRGTFEEGKQNSKLTIFVFNLSNYVKSEQKSYESILPNFISSLTHIIFLFFCN